MTPRPTNLNKAASDAVQVISDAANKATTAIAEAALNATKLLATNAQEAAKVVNTKGADDHDLLIKLDTKVEALRSDIRELSDGTERRITTLENEKLNKVDAYPALYKAGVEASIKDHEDRIRINTGRITQILTWGSAALIALGILEFVINLLLK